MQLFRPHGKEARRLSQVPQSSTYSLFLFLSQYWQAIAGLSNSRKKKSAEVTVVGRSSREELAVVLLFGLEQFPFPLSKLHIIVTFFIQDFDYTVSPYFHTSLTCFVRNKFFTNVTYSKVKLMLLAKLQVRPNTAGHLVISTQLMPHQIKIILFLKKKTPLTIIAENHFDKMSYILFAPLSS